MTNGLKVFNLPDFEAILQLYEFVPHNSFKYFELLRFFPASADVNSFQVQQLQTGHKMENLGTG